MPKITNEEDFKKIINLINFFSHAYILSSNNLQETLPYAKILAIKIITEKITNNEEIEDITYKIEHDIFDDLYIVNPNTIGINNEEIEKLLKYMETKSTRNNGKRVYIINGLERITRDISNKILKFLEEPEEGIYAILITSQIDKVLPTIISRTQIINLTFNQEIESIEKIDIAKKFINNIVENKEKTIAYTNILLHDIISNREEVYQLFECIEKIISNNINKKYSLSYNEIYSDVKIENYSIISLTNILDVTNKLKQLIKKNINLNLIIDRYIIEVGKEVKKC